MSRAHDFENTVVAILPEKPLARDAVESLSSAGYEVEVLKGEKGRNHINADTDDGLLGSIRALATALGDQRRIVQRLDEAMRNGRVVVSVDVAENDAGDAISILQDHGGHYIWRLGEWTFTPIES